MLKLTMIYTLRLVQRLHIMMLNLACFASAEIKLNVSTLPLRKECCDPLWMDVKDKRVIPFGSKGPFLTLLDYMLY